jgi:2-dehydro-3-deoxyphosphogluconate aldolase/(4S)-4-hydroxy-2-oxoglutarate aldolase
MIPETLVTRLHRSGVVAVLVVDEVAHAVPVARALLAGGVDVIELTLRTPVALEALRRIREEVPDMVCGVGTVLTPEQVGAVREAGAAFGVAPGLNPRVVKEAARAGLPFAPGVCTPSDVELALELECRVLKFFPCEPSGGLAYLRALAAPFSHLGVRYLPLGGIGPGNAAAYLAEPAVLALGGSWLAPRDRLFEEDWDGVTRLARDARELVDRARNG